jgi:hypothetical protein
MLLAIATAVIGWVFALAVVAMNNKDRQETAAAHERALDWERSRTDALIAQVQANAQGFQHYPTLGPTEPTIEPNILRDPTGLIEYDASDDDFEAVIG